MSLIDDIFSGALFDAEPTETVIADPETLRANRRAINAIPPATTTTETPGISTADKFQLGLKALSSIGGLVESYQNRKAQEKANENNLQREAMYQLMVAAQGGTPGAPMRINAAPQVDYAGALSQLGDLAGAYGGMKKQAAQSQAAQALKQQEFGLDRAALIQKAVKDARDVSAKAQQSAQTQAYRDALLALEARKTGASEQSAAGLQDYRNALLALQKMKLEKPGAEKEMDALKKVKDFLSIKQTLQGKEKPVDPMIQTAIDLMRKQQGLPPASTQKASPINLTAEEMAFLKELAPQLDLGAGSTPSATLPNWGGEAIRWR